MGPSPLYVTSEPLDQRSNVMVRYLLLSLHAGRLDKGPSEQRPRSSGSRCCASIILEGDGVERTFWAATENSVGPIESSMGEGGTDPQINVQELIGDPEIFHPPLAWR